MLRSVLTVLTMAACIVLASYCVDAQNGGRPRDPLDERFRELDRNGDGKITRGPPRYFDRLDKNKEGVLTADELQDVVTIDDVAVWEALPRDEKEEKGRKKEKLKDDESVIERKESLNEPRKSECYPSRVSERGHMCNRSGGSYCRHRLRGRATLGP